MAALNVMMDSTSSRLAARMISWFGRDMRTMS
jgi:hypothetical protein